MLNKIKNNSDHFEVTLVHPTAIRKEMQGLVEKAIWK